MIDVQATLRWVQGVITDPAGTATAYREPLASWQQTFMQITLPVYVVAYLLAAVVAAITGGNFLLGSIGFFVLSLVWVLAWTFVIAFIFDYLAGTFGGTRNFDAAYAVVGLAIVPAALGTVIGPLPWLGWLLSLAASIYSLVLAYRFIPGYLAVPDDARAKHFGLSILFAFVVNLIVTFALGGLFASSFVYEPDFSAESESSTATSTEGGLFGGIDRQADIADSAANDTYEPPADGKLTEKQVAQFVYVFEKTKQLRSRLTERIEAASSQEEKPSFGDVFGSIGDAVRAGTAEMEVVKTAGGNWAEHQWVRGQLETARIHQDLNDTTRHNYQLMLKFEDKLNELGF